MLYQLSLVLWDLEKCQDSAVQPSLPVCKCRLQGPAPLVPKHKPPPTAIGRPDLHGIPQLVGQVIRADAIWEALRQQHGSEAQKSGQCCPGPPASTRVLPRFHYRGPGEPAPALSPVPLQTPIGGSAAAAWGSGAELLSAQPRSQACSVSHPPKLSESVQRSKKLDKLHLLFGYGGRRGTIIFYCLGNQIIVCPAFLGHSAGQHLACLRFFEP